MENIIWGVAMLLGAALLIWLGFRYRRNRYKGYQEDVKKYTASTTMKVVHLEKSESERWEERDNGQQELIREIVYKPTYEYTVNGETYQYYSRYCLGSEKDLGRLVTGYYNPANPKDITEYKPRKPIFGGFLFFVGAAFLVFMAVMIIRDELYLMF